RFGKSGHYYYQIARAIDNRKVNPNRIQKSLGAENTFSSDLMSYESVRRELVEISEVLHRRMERSKTVGRTLTVKAKYTDFRTVTRSKTIDQWIENIEQIQAIYEELLPSIPIEDGIRLLGLSLSNLNHEEQQEEQPKVLQMTLEF
ncbi:MAG: DNA polymerase IV, partial [Fulvivirga sp.]